MCCPGRAPGDSLFFMDVWKGFLPGIFMLILQVQTVTEQHETSMAMEAEVH